jgi:hypothetical protein
MKPTDTMLSLDMGSDDCLYRFRRDANNTSIVVYVHFKPLDIVACELVPRLIAYVYERSEEQIIGFVCEKFEGHFAGPSDYIPCKRGLQQLHSYGCVHGDLNRFNIMITSSGPRFVDFEKSILEGSVSKDDFLRLQREELDSLQGYLNDQEDWGKP